MKKQEIKTELERVKKECRPQEPFYGSILLEIVIEILLETMEKEKK